MSLSTVKQPAGSVSGVEGDEPLLGDPLRNPRPSGTGRMWMWAGAQDGLTNRLGGRGRGRPGGTAAAAAAARTAARGFGFWFTTVGLGDGGATGAL